MLCEARAQALFTDRSPAGLYWVRKSPVGTKCLGSLRFVRQKVNVRNWLVAAPVAGVLCACTLALAVSSASAATAYTWRGTDSSSASWSAGDNWVGATAPSASDSGDSLVFPGNLTGGNCSTTQADACYVSEDNFAGYAINSLSIDDGAGYYVAPDDLHDPLTVGPGGITAATNSSTFNPAEFGLPIALGANQTWFVNGGADGLGQLDFDAGLSGSSTLDVDLADQGYVDLDDASDSEVGNVTATGPSAGGSGTTAAANGAIELDGAKLNASNGNTVTLDNATLFGSGTVGTLISDGGQIEPGDPTGGIAVNGNVSFNENASFDDSAFTPLIIDAGTTPDTDFSQLTATGTVTLGFANLDIEAGNDTNSCPTLNLGAVYTLISASSIVGYLGDLGGGAGYESTMNCTGSNAPVFNIAYNRSASPETVTATVVGPAATTYTNLDTPYPDPPDAGQSMTLTASVEADAPVTDAVVTPVGTIEFENGGTPIAGCTSQPLSLHQTPLSNVWQATCTTTASQAAGAYSYEARFNPTDTQTGGQLTSVSTAQTGQVVAFSLDGGTASLGNVTTKGLVATVPFDCTGITGEFCSDVNASLSVKETLKNGKVVAVTTSAKPKTTKRTIVIGSGSTTIGVGSTAMVKLQLNGTGQALLKTHHRLKVELTIASRGSVLATKTLTFTESAAKKTRR